MKSGLAAITTFCLVGVCGSCIIRATEIPAGIYQVVADGEGQPVKRTTGGTIDLGDRVTDNLGEVTIWSTSNENDRFRVLLKRSGPFDTSGRQALYVDGVCEPISSYSEPDGDGKIEVIADLDGQMNAMKIASTLNVPLNERKHPGHQLLVRWQPVKESFKIGEAITLELSIVNVGSTVVRFMEGGQQRGSRDNQFGFTAFSGFGSGKAVPDTGDPMSFGGIGAFRELQPNEIFRKQVDISKWFKFEQADTYQVTGMYELELQTEDFGARALWDEFATGRCLVRIEE